MSLVTYKYDFTSTLQGFTAITLTGGATAPVWFSSLSSNGNSDAGCMMVQTSTNGTWLLRSAAGITWETLGVPVGATVTNVQNAVSYTQYQGASFLFNASYLRIVSAGVNISTAGNLRPLNSPANTLWSAQNGGTIFAVDSAYQASNTPIQYEIFLSLNASSLTSYYFDPLSFTITYTGGGGGGGGGGGSTTIYATISAAVVDDNTIRASILQGIAAVVDDNNYRGIE